MSANEKKYLGIDVSKDSICAFLYPTGEVWEVKNEPREIKKWIKTLPGEIELAVMEATGKFEQLVAKQLDMAGIPISIVNPRLIRSFAYFMGISAKTDKIDARVIAMFGNTRKPDPTKLPDEMESSLKELVIRRFQIVDLIKEEKNHLSTSNDKLVQKDVQEHIEILKKRLDKIEAQIKTMINENPIWKEKVKILTSIIGVGIITAFSFIATFPELGSISRKEAASLAGLAPMTRQSGDWQGKSFTQGGRKLIRSSLFMAALSAIRYNKIIAEFYQRLIAKGKPKMIAITACMRKILTILNALVRDNSKWNYAEI